MQLQCSAQNYELRDMQQVTHHEMRIPKRDDLLAVYIFMLINISVDIYG